LFWTYPSKKKIEATIITPFVFIAVQKTVETVRKSFVTRRTILKKSVLMKSKGERDWGG
jgi:hypothetical protein